MADILGADPVTALSLADLFTDLAAFEADIARCELDLCMVVWRGDDSRGDLAERIKADRESVATIQAELQRRELIDAPSPWGALPAG